MINDLHCILILQSLEFHIVLLYFLYFSKILVNNV
jgi:hypothetical protein